MCVCVCVCCVCAVCVIYLCYICINLTLVTVPGIELNWSDTIQAIVDHQSGRRYSVAKYVPSEQQPPYLLHYE